MRLISENYLVSKHISYTTLPTLYIYSFYPIYFKYQVWFLRNMSLKGIELFAQIRPEIGKKIEKLS